MYLTSHGRNITFIINITKAWACQRIACHDEQLSRKYRPPLLPRRAYKVEFLWCILKAISYVRSTLLMPPKELMGMLRSANSFLIPKDRKLLSTHHLVPCNVPKIGLLHPKDIFKILVIKVSIMDGKDFQNHFIYLSKTISKIILVVPSQRINAIF